MLFPDCIVIDVYEGVAIYATVQTAVRPSEAAVPMPGIMLAAPESISQVAAP